MGPLGGAHGENGYLSSETFFVNIDPEHLFFVGFFSSLDNPKKP